MNKKMKAALMTAILGLGMAPGNVHAEEPEQIDIVFLVDSFNASWQYIVDGCAERCQSFSEENPEYQVNFSYMNADNSIDKQIADLDTAVVSGADVIILSAVDSAGLLSAAEKIADEGTVVVDYRGMGSENENIIFYDGANEEAKGEMAKDWLTQYLDENPDKTLHAGFLAGAATTVSCLPRVQIPETLADENDRMINEVETYSDWTTDNAISITLDWLQTYPELNCIVTASEPLAQGVASALNINGVGDDFIVVTYNGEEPGMVMFKNGEVDCDIATDMKAVTKGLIDVSLDAYINGYRGTYSAGEDNLRTITMDNYKKWCEELGITLE